MWRFWQKHGHLAESRARLEAMAAAPWSNDDPRLRARLLEALGGTLWWQGEIPEMGRRYEEALAIWEGIGDDAEIANAHYNASFIHAVPRGAAADPSSVDPESVGMRHIEAARDIYHRIGDRRGEANALWALGNYHYFHEDAGSGVVDVGSALQIFREVGDRTMEAWSLHMLGVGLLRNGDLAGAREAVEQAIRLFQAAGDAAGVTLTLAGATNAAISWATTEADGPSTNIILATVTDRVNGHDFIRTNSFTVIVREINTAPQLTVPANQVLDELTPLSASASATDSDLPPNPLTFLLVAPPVGMLIDAATGAISWTPTEAQGPSTNIITVIVTDDSPAAANAVGRRKSLRRASADQRPRDSTGSTSPTGPLVSVARPKATPASAIPLARPVSRKRCDAIMPSVRKSVRVMSVMAKRARNAYSSEVARMSAGRSGASLSGLPSGDRRRRAKT
jgi:tetratricopeptide (TPR) repeat protein